MTAPSLAYRQHHDIEAPRVDALAFRQGWRVVTRLDALHRDGRISAGQWQAAVEYRAAWERALTAGGGGAGALVRIGAGGAGDGAASRLAAAVDGISRVRQVHAAIGGHAALCFLCIVEDRSWADSGRALGRDPQTVRDWTVLAIAALARAWPRAAWVPGPVLDSGLTRRAAGGASTRPHVARHTGE
jgi:hypothetical protein